MSKSPRTGIKPPLLPGVRPSDVDYQTIPIQGTLKFQIFLLDVLQLCGNLLRRCFRENQRDCLIQKGWITEQVKEWFDEIFNQELPYKCAGHVTVGVL